MDRARCQRQDRPERDGTLRAAQLFRAPQEAPTMGLHPEVGKSPVDVPRRSGTCSRSIFCNIKVRSSAGQGCATSPAGREEDAHAENDPNPSHGSPASPVQTASKMKGVCEDAEFESQLLGAVLDNTAEVCAARHMGRAGGLGGFWSGTLRGTWVLLPVVAAWAALRGLWSSPTASGKQCAAA